MGGVADGQLIRLDGWPQGIDNVNAEFAVPAPLSTQTPNGLTGRLREAVNVDIDRQGKVSRRAGYSLSIASNDVHSLWAPDGAQYGFAVIDGVLTALDNQLNQTPIRSGLSSLHPVSYTRVNNIIFWSNRQASGRITSTLQDAPFALNSPNGFPVLSTTPLRGGLQIGEYQVAVTFVSQSGEESGTSLAGMVSITTQGDGIELGKIPQPVDPDVVAVRIYRTQTNGDVLYHVRDVPVGMTTANLYDQDLGKPLETQWLNPLPPGQIVRYFNGRIYVAAGNTLWYSEALRYGYRNTAKNFIRFNAEIDMVAPVGDASAGGVYVAAGERTYFLNGAEPKAMQQVIAQPVGVIPGSHVETRGSVFDSDDARPLAFWVSKNGVPSLGVVGGNITPLTENQYVTPTAQRGTSFFRERDGKRQMIFGLKGAQQNVLRTSDSVVATVVRNGVTLD